MDTFNSTLKKIKYGKNLMHSSAPYKNKNEIQ